MKSLKHQWFLNCKFYASTLALINASILLKHFCRQDLLEMNELCNLGFERNTATAMTPSYITLWSSKWLAIELAWVKKTFKSFVFALYHPPGGSKRFPQLDFDLFEPIWVIHSSQLTSLPPQKIAIHWHHTDWDWCQRLRLWRHQQPCLGLWAQCGHLQGGQQETIGHLERPKNCEGKASASNFLRWMVVVKTSVWGGLMVAWDFGPFFWWSLKVLSCLKRPMSEPVVQKGTNFYVLRFLKPKAPKTIQKPNFGYLKPGFWGKKPWFLIGFLGPGTSNAAASSPGDSRDQYGGGLELYAEVG